MPKYEMGNRCATGKQVKCILALEYEQGKKITPMAELKKLSCAEASKRIDELRAVLEKRAGDIDKPGLGMVFKLVVQESNVNWILHESEEFLQRVKKLYWVYKEAEKVVGGVGKCVRFKKGIVG